MFNNRKIKKLEESNRELLERVRELGDEVAKLKSACTMRVGEYKRSESNLYGYFSGKDLRPTATAIELIQQLMGHQKLTIEPVPATSATYMLSPKDPA